MMHFASELFDTHPRFIQLKSLLMDFFNAEVIDSICLPGLEHVISVSLSPTPLTPPLSNGTTSMSDSDSVKNLPKVHIRTYTTRLLSSGTRVPRVELTPMGPFIDLSLRRHQPPDAELWKAAMKRPKMKKTEVEKGLGKKRKNMEVDEMGDLRGRVHVMKQDLEKLQNRKMKGLKAVAGEEESDGEEDTVRRKKRRAE
jgi:ribosome production factor 2